MRTIPSFIMALALSVGISLPASAAQNVEIQAGVFGGTLYQMSYAFTEVLKANAPDIKATAVETSGTAMGVVKAAASPKDRILAGTLVPVMEARKGVAPYKQAFTGLKAIGNLSENIQTLISFNPAIKTLADLNGKRLGLGPKPTVLGHSHASITLAGVPNPDSMKVFYMDWGSMRDGMLDGSLDAMILGVGTKQTPPWAPVAVYPEMVASRGIPQFIDLPADVVKKAAAADGIDYPLATIPAGSIAENVPPRDVAAWRDMLGFFAFDDLPEETAYLLAKTLYEKCGDMATYSAAAKGVWPALVVPNLPDDQIHAGALRYYKEKGLR